MPNLRLALRSLAKAPGFTLTAVLMLALGIGFSTSSFSVANAFLLRNVPYPESDRLVRIFRTTEQSATQGHSPANLLDLRRTLTSYTGIGIYSGQSYALGEPGQPAEHISGVSATADFFTILGVQPRLGRGFAPGDDAPGKPLIAIVTHRLWVRHFGSDPAVVGRQIRLDSAPATIVGVLPPEFDAPLVWGPVDVIVPRTLEPTFATERSNPWMHSIARLKPGVTLRQAQAELDTFAARLAREYPKENGRDGLRVVALYTSNMDGVSRNLMWLMTALSLTMLIIACANLASLQVARALSRAREFAVRAALGASHRQLMLPLAAESVVLASIGGALGLLVALWTNDIVGANLSINREPGFAIPLDERVLVFAAVASVISGLAFGLAPAWLAGRAPAGEILKDGSRGNTGTASHHRLKRALIVVELALALALVGVAASFGLGAQKFFRRPLGWNIDGVLSGQIVLPYNRYADDHQCRAFTRSLLERLAATPGVERAALGNGAPLYELGRLQRVVAEGRPAVEQGREPTAATLSVTPDWFHTLGIPFQRGAAFSASLQPEDPRVAVINESTARQLWPNEDPIGRRLRFADRDQWITVIGVVADIRLAVRPESPETRLNLFLPYVQTPSHFLTVVARTSVPPETLAPTLRRLVAELDADLPVENAHSLRTEADLSLTNVNLIVANLATSAVMGLVIAAIGLFGVISQLTVQRTRDIGVRMALGAQAGDIARMILGEGARLLLVGVVVGAPLLLALNELLRRVTSEIALPGAWVLVGNVIVLSATMLLACWLPARRAMHINPVEALRAD
ncbi:ABC transporter permease [Opitutus sp. ER46]|uniref:ABC transporter permease n=1 Tax=Opitutus sp. ER46 TaxID=2161864 RepID=UPI000D31EA32|nr:ABC transporter permease [Opitutus sp. ER46]